MTATDHFEALRMAVLRDLPDSNAEGLRFARQTAKALDLPEDVTRTLLRNLRDAGLVLLSHAYCFDDGSPCGSGWRRTRKGDHLLHQTRETDHA